MKKQGYSPGSSQLVVDEHISQYFSDEEITVLHEIESDEFHIDVYHIKATAERPYQMLITNGMSSIPMNAPDDLEELKYTEIMTVLPADWEISESSIRNEANSWPISWIKELARLPHENEDWLWYGHTIPNGDPAEIIAENTKFSGVILLRSNFLDEEFLDIPFQDTNICLLSMVPLYSEELAYAEEFDAEKLVEKFKQKFESPLEVEAINVERANSCLNQESNNEE